MDVQWLGSPEGQRVIDRVRGMDPLRARAELPDVDPGRLADALTQAAHRPADYPLLLVTDDGVQQASPPEVARRRAHRLAAVGVGTVIDAGCGIGMDAHAFASAGMQVIAYEADADTARVAGTNLRGLPAQVIGADVTRADLPPGALFVDPARRRAQRDAAGRPVRIHDPQQWSPPWAWVLDQAAQRPVVARIRPGHRDLPAGAEWHCSSIRRSLVDATAWFGPLARVSRRASMWTPDGWHELAGDPGRADSGPAAAYIVDPDPAIVRAGLVANLAEQIGGRLLDRRLAFVTTDAEPPGWAGRSMRVLTDTPLKRIAATCRSLGIESATLWSRGFHPAPRIGVRQGQQGVVVAARIGDERHSRAWVGVPVH